MTGRRQKSGVDDHRRLFRREHYELFSQAIIRADNDLRGTKYQCPVFQATTGTTAQRWSDCIRSTGEFRGSLIERQLRACSVICENLLLRHGDKRG